MAVKLLTSEKIIETVINHQFTSATNALLKHNSLEISGFGKLLFNPKKAHKKFETMLVQKEKLQKHLTNPEVSEKRKETAKAKIDSLEISIQLLKPKIDNVRLQQDLRGMEEQTDSPSPSENAN